MGTHRAHRERPAWFTKLRAVLAGAVVLGIGTAVTVAAWNDSEHAAGTFTASVFHLEGATDGESFSNHGPDNDPATLSFDVEPDALSPGTTVYALFSVRTTADSTDGGTVLLEADSGNGSDLGQFLTYGVRTISGTTCDSSAFSGGDAVVDEGQPLTASAPSSRTQDVAKEAGDQVNYCFAITLPDGTSNDAQGQSVTAHWTFTGASSS